MQWSHVLLLACSCYDIHRHIRSSQSSPESKLGNTGSSRMWDALT